MARKKDDASGSGRQRGIGGFVDRLNRTLFPWLGPPPLGPYDEPVVQRPPARCPLCGELMSDHEIDRTGPRTMVHCPR